MKIKHIHEGDISYHYYLHDVWAESSPMVIQFKCSNCEHTISVMLESKPELNIFLLHFSTLTSEHGK